MKQGILRNRQLSRKPPYVVPLRVEALENRQLMATVDTLIDVNANDGVTTLREAIAAAAPGETIDFSVSGQINLSNLGPLVINKDLTIQGPVSDPLTINAFDPTPAIKNADGSRVFIVDDGTAAVRTVAINGLTLTGGDVFGIGGAIINVERLTMDSCTISGNVTLGYDAHGGGIFTDGSLTLTRSRVIGNSVRGLGSKGGGIFALGSLTLTQSTVSGNSTDDDYASGGGIFSFGPVTLNGSNISENRTVGYGSFGGGIYAYGTSTLTNSTIHGNSTAGMNSGGGGIIAYTVKLNQSTVSGNHTSGDHSRGGGVLAANVTLNQSTVSGNTTAGNYSAGGGIHAYTVRLNQSTVSENTTEGLNSSGGGVFQGDLSNNFPLSITSSILAGNSSAVGEPDLAIDPDSSLTVDFSLIGTGIMPDFGGNNISSNTPLLSPLANHGGPTATHALLPGSPALNAGDPAAVAGANGIPQFDQRGAPFLRVAEGRIDIGAFERQPADFNGDQVLDGNDIDLLVAAIVNGGPIGFDLTGDGLVNLADRDQWLALAGALNLPSGHPYRLGDANLDGVVDGSDFGLWNSNKFTSIARWTRGDFTADGVVDGSDFGVWNANKFTAADSARPSRPEAVSASSALPHSISFAQSDRTKTTVELTLGAFCPTSERDWACAKACRIKARTSRMPRM